MEILTLAQKRKKERDEVAMKLYEQLRRENPEASRSAVERTIAREMAERGYDLTTRMGVHNVLARMMLQASKKD